MKRLMLVSGNSNFKLANSISQSLNSPLIDSNIVRFANGELYCEIGQNVRGADVFVIQSICPPQVNDYLMELLIILDALKRASAQSITAVIPHYGYSRQDRKSNPRSPISAKLVADLLTVAGATRVITMELHANQIQGFFNIPFDNIYSDPVAVSYLRQHVGDQPQEYVCVSPDSGGVERVRRYARHLQCDLALIDKRRVARNIAQAMHVVGEVRDKNVILIDDIIDTAGTLIESVKALKAKGAREVSVFATHPIFSDPAFERITSCEELTEVIVTDTIPLEKRWSSHKKIKILSTANLFGKVILNTFNDDSVSSVFRL